MTLKEYIIRWHKDQTGQTEGAQSAFAAEVKVNTASVSHWIAGRCRPSKQRIASMAEILKLDIKLLERIVDDRNRQWKEKEYQSIFPVSRVALNGPSPQLDIQPELIKVVGTISTPTFPSPEGAPAEEQLSLPVPPGYKNGDVFAFKISGNFMAPMVADREYVMIARNCHFRSPSDICVARTENGYGFYRIKALPQQLERAEFSPETAPNPITEENKIFGKVLWILRKP